MQAQLQNRGVAILDAASRHVSREAKRAYNRDEHEDFSITLKLLELLRDGWASGPVFDVACGYAVGLTHHKYLYKRAERAAFVRREFLRAIPDYDYSREALPERDPTDGRRHYGNQHRLGKRDRIRNLAAESIARPDTITGRVSNEYQSAKCERPGDRLPVADDRYPVPDLLGAGGHAARPVADRRSARAPGIFSGRSRWTDLDLLGRRELGRTLSRARWAKYYRNSQDTEASTAGVLEYLERAEATETDLSRQCDLRMAWITVGNAARGLEKPFVAACYAIHGVHPDKLQAKTEARRKAKLGTLFGKVCLEEPRQHEPDPRVPCAA